MFDLNINGDHHECEEHFQEGQAHDEGDETFFFSAFRGMQCKHEGKKAEEYKKEQGSPGQGYSRFPAGPLPGKKDTRYRDTGSDEELPQEMPKFHRTSSTNKTIAVIAFLCIVLAEVGRQPF